MNSDKAIKFLTLFIILVSVAKSCFADDLDKLLEAGELRHLGVPYCNFVTASGTGLDIELKQGFAQLLGVRYRFQETTWNRAIGDLSGQHVRKAFNSYLDKIRKDGRYQQMVKRHFPTAFLYYQDFFDR